MAVTGIEIAGRELFADGTSFGAVGAYELVTGVVRFAVDPDAPANVLIADVELAAQEADGRVHFDADFAVLRPVDAAKGNRRLFFEVVNRGNKQATNRFNLGSQLAEGGLDAGDGFLMRRGYTVAWCGWQPDLPARPGPLGMRAPEALQDGERLRGRLQVEFQPTAAVRSVLLSDRGHRPYAAAELDEATAVLSVRDSERGERRVIARDQWRFAREEAGVAIADAGHVYRAAGFEAGKLYDLVYSAVGAPVIGLGLLTMRDFVSFLRHAPAVEDNPCADSLDFAYGMGASQSGRFLRSFLYLGLNEDEEQRQVFDGAIVHIAAHARGQFNQRFGQPSSNSRWDSAGSFPFAATHEREPVSGIDDGLLDRLLARGRAPKLIFTNTAKEYWNGGASLTHTDPAQQHDLDLPASVRGYFFAGTQHTAGVLPLTDQAGDGLRGRYALNSVDYRPLLRAALANLDAWVSEGVEPPPSRLPRLDDGTLVPVEDAAEVQATIPGVDLPLEWPRILRLDFGADAARGVMSVPPRFAGPPYEALAGAVDADGNDVAGIRLPDVAVPLATFAGWNLRHPNNGAPTLLLSLQGATHPFARDAAERAATGDPRPSIAERYASKVAYVEQVRAAAEQLVDQRYLLSEDVDTVGARAELRWDLFTASALEVRSTAPVSAEAL